MQISYDTVIYRTLMCTYTVSLKLLTKGKNIFAMYRASLFPPLVQLFYQLKTSINANGLCTPESRAITISAVLIVSPSPKKEMPKIL